MLRANLSFRSYSRLKAPDSEGGNYARVHAVYQKRSPTSRQRTFRIKVKIRRKYCYLPDGNCGLVGCVRSVDAGRPNNSAPIPSRGTRRPNRFQSVRRSAPTSGVTS